MRIILASASPRRLQLLRDLGVEPEVWPSAIDESAWSGETGAAYVERLAREKSEAAEALRGDVVLAADTAVVVDERILGKPSDRAEAVEFLHLLRGRSHEVLTGVAVRSELGLVSDVEVSSVEFASLTNEELDWYVASGEGFDKAGGYAIQGAGGMFVKAIYGSLDNVIGLPRHLTSALFGSLGLRLLDFSEVSNVRRQHIHDHRTQSQ